MSKRFCILFLVFLTSCNLFDDGNRLQLERDASDWAGTDTSADLGNDSDVCVAPCDAPECNDQIKNGSETDLDCGGNCSPCGLNLKCGESRDCASALCFDGFCVTPICGDTIVSGTEHCDDGGDSMNCNADCTPALCGDGKINSQAEEDCDDGNTTTETCDYGMLSCTICDATCSKLFGLTSFCGDGAIDISNGEECDDGNSLDDDRCSNSCQTNPRRVFTTSQFTTSDFGGLAGGDAFCQNLAEAAGLKGTYIAWLSDSTGSPSTRFIRSTVPYVLVDGTRVADDWDDLTDGVLQHPINLTENATTPPESYNYCFTTRRVWSDTDITGTANSSSAHCSNWTGMDIDGKGAKFANWDEEGRSWSDGCQGNDCVAGRALLYCFEQ